MGDIGQGSELWMPPMTPQALPMGKSNIYPLGERHVSRDVEDSLHSEDSPVKIQGVSVSLPTWDSVIGLSRKEKWVLDHLETSYPRYCVLFEKEAFKHPLIRQTASISTSQCENSHWQFYNDCFSPRLAQAVCYSLQLLPPGNVLQRLRNLRRRGLRWLSSGFFCPQNRPRA
jgi:hypothetical protein